MSAERIITAREKFIIFLTVVAVLGAVVWYGFLESYIENWKTVTAAIETTQKTLAAQAKLMAKGNAIDADYKVFESTLPKPQENKKPQSLFDREITNFCGSAVSLATHDVLPVEGALDYAYICVDISRLRGDLPTIAKVLREVHKRNLRVQTLEISPLSHRANPELDVDLGIGQLWREADLDKVDRMKVDEARKKAKKK